MDRVFPENMNPVSVDDTKDALSTHDFYIRYMRENIEHAVYVLTKNSGASLADLASKVSSLETRVNDLEARVTELENE